MIDDEKKKKADEERLFKAIGPTDKELEKGEEIEGWFKEDSKSADLSSFRHKKIKNNKIDQVCGFTKLSDKILYNTEIVLQNKIDWLRMRRIKDLEINTSKSEKPFTPNWKAVGTILGINGEMLRQQITSTICATKDKKGFITNYTSSNDGFSFDITDELVNSDYNKRIDNQKKISDEEVEELMKDIPSAEEQLLEMINEEKEEVIIEVKNKKYEEVPEDLDEFYESIKEEI